MFWLSSLRAVCFDMFWLSSLRAVNLLKFSIVQWQISVVAEEIQTNLQSKDVTRLWTVLAAVGSLRQCAAETTQLIKCVAGFKGQGSNFVSGMPIQSYTSIFNSAQSSTYVQFISQMLEEMSQFATRVPWVPWPALLRLKNFGTSERDCWHNAKPKRFKVPRATVDSSIIRVWASCISIEFYVLW